MTDWPAQDDAIHQLLAWLPSTYTRLSRKVPDADVASGAALARCSRLLLGLDVVCHAGDQEDLAGLYVRPLFETWLTGLYVHYCGHDAWEELKVATRREMEVLNRQAELGNAVVAGWTNQSRGPSVEVLATKVGAFLKALGEDAPGFPAHAYNLVYRNASIRDVHGGAGPLTGHVSLSSAGYAEVLPVRQEGISSRVHLLWCSVLVTVLAQRVFDRFELPVYRRRLDEMTEPLEWRSIDADDNQPRT